MKKLMLCALAILLALSTAIPASAQSRRRNDGYRGTPLEAVTRQNMGMVNGLLGELGYGYPGRYDSYDYRYNRRYGRGLSRNEVLGGVAVIGGIWAIDKVVNRNRDDNHTGTETPAQCFERVMKALRKQGGESNTEHAMAFCSGQPTQEPARAERSYDEGRVVDQEPEPEIQPEQTRVFRNCTSGQVYVGDPEAGDGFNLKPGEIRQAPASWPAYGKFNGEFRQARIVWHNGLALITAPEGA